MVIDQSEVGRRLAAIMAYLGLSPEELEDRTGISRQTIWRYRTGRSRQAFAEMAVIADVTGANLDYLAYGNEPMFKQPFVLHYAAKTQIQVAP